MYLLNLRRHEISAWKHAIVDFSSLEPNEMERKIFTRIMENGLKSYKIKSEVIEELTSLLC